MEDKKEITILQKICPREARSYETLLKNYSRDGRRSERTECECGKTIFKSQYEKHITTAMHAKLLRLKEKKDQVMVGTEQSEQTFEKFLIKLAENIEFRNRIENVITLLNQESIKIKEK